MKLSSFTLLLSLLINFYHYYYYCIYNYNFSLQIDAVLTFLWMIHQTLRLEHYL